MTTLRQPSIDEREPEAASVRPIQDPAGARLALWGVAAAIVLGTVLRIHQALVTPMWFDEVFTLWVARLEPGAMMKLLAQDMHPPLHFLLVAGWRAVGGESELWLKTSSIVCGLVTIGVVYAFGRDAFGRLAGVLAAALLAFHYIHIDQSQELRSYALLWLALTAAAWMAYRWGTRGRRSDGIGFVLAATVALYTHYLAILGLGCVFAWGVWASRGNPRRLAGWIGWCALAGALLLPQLPTLLVQLHRNVAEHWIRTATTGQLVDLARKTAFGAYYMLPVVALLAVAPLLHRAQRRPALLLWTLTAAPVALTWLLTRNGAHLFTERYMSYIVPLCCLLAAAGIAAIERPRWRRVVAVGLVAFAARSALVSPPHRESVMLQRAELLLAPSMRPGDVVVHADPHSLLYFRQHRPHLGRHVLLLTRDRVPYYDGGLLIRPEWILRPEGLAALEQRGARWWAVRTRTGGMDYRPAESLIESYAHGGRNSFGPVTVWAGGPNLAFAGH